MSLEELETRVRVLEDIEDINGSSTVIAGIATTGTTPTLSPIFSPKMQYGTGGTGAGTRAGRPYGSFSKSLPKGFPSPYTW